jgi:Phosphotransferase enzyme family
MATLKKETVERYLAAVLGKQVSVVGMAVLGESPGEAGVKGFGYGTPVRIDYQASGEPLRTAVFHTMSPNAFGHEHMSDRAQVLLWQHGAFNRLPRHVRSLDVGAFHSDGGLVSLGAAGEFCLLTEYAEGADYAQDLERLRRTDKLTDLDLARADGLCDYLVEIHRTKGGEAGLYRRRIRELVGHGECIMGLTDSYPPHPLIPATLLEEIEHRCVKWRWRLKPLVHRLRQVHGDFHPWNILFRAGTDFGLLDRSRGEWGEPADDVACLTSNYLFFSLQRSQRLEGAFATLFSRFWKRYLEQSGDREMLSVAAPFYAFRGLVMASPVWYPGLPDAVRQKLLGFVMALLDADAFDPAKAADYIGS